VAGGAQGSSLLIAVSNDVCFAPADEVHPVPGIGGKAYVLEPSGSDRTLHLLDGGAAPSLQVSGYSRWNGTGTTPAGSGDSRNPPT
jgi:hypothetical protein